MDFENETNGRGTAINAVKNTEIKIELYSYEELWFDKLNNIKDWCNCRQLSWGHRSAYNDTWFLVALLPLTVMGWTEGKYSKYYPLGSMEIGHGSLFFSVACMAVLPTALVGEFPFKEVLLHEIVCDSQGRKMSKSRGNITSPEYVIDGISRDDLNAKALENFSIGILCKAELKCTVAVNAKMFPAEITECGIDALKLTLVELSQDLITKPAAKMIVYRARREMLPTIPKTLREFTSHISNMPENLLASYYAHFETEEGKIGVVFTSEKLIDALDDRDTQEIFIDGTFDLRHSGDLTAVAKPEAAENRLLEGYHGDDVVRAAGVREENQGGIDDSHGRDESSQQYPLAGRS
ncbi:hypothetical protein PV326_005648 [Microctonus aethiopoides]|nr:hypothetical protein PV326_005648 [Microctonus aethiopoides]